MDSIPKLEKLNEMKQAEYQHAAAVHRQVREARLHSPGLRYELAQRLITLATWLSPAHRALGQTLRGEGGAPVHTRKRHI